MSHKEQTTPETLERPVVKPTGDLNGFYRYQIFTLDSNVVKIQNECSAHTEAQ